MQRMYIEYPRLSKLVFGCIVIAVGIAGLCKTENVTGDKWLFIIICIGFICLGIWLAFLYMREQIRYRQLERRTKNCR